VEGLTLGSRGVGTRAGLTSWGVRTTSRRVSMVVLVIMRLGGGGGSTAEEAEAPPSRRRGGTSTILMGLGVGRRASVGRAIFRNIKNECEWLLEKLDQNGGKDGEKLDQNGISHHRFT